MKKNMGNIDRLIRSFLALNIIFFYSRDFISGIGGTILLVVALVFLVTSLFAYCPLYALLGIHTNKLKDNNI